MSNDPALWKRSAHGPGLLTGLQAIDPIIAMLEWGNKLKWGNENEIF